MISHSILQRVHDRSIPPSFFFLVFLLICSFVLASIWKVFFFYHPLGEPSKRIFGNSWDSVPTKGGGEVNPKFLSIFSKIKCCLGTVHKCYKNGKIICIELPKMQKNVVFLVLCVPSRPSWYKIPRISEKSLFAASS